MRFFLLGLLILSKCNTENPNQKMIQSVFEGEENVRVEVLHEKEIELNSKIGNEKILIIRNVQEEILAVFSLNQEKPILEQKNRFTTPNYGPFQYSWKKKAWERAEYSVEKESYLIQNMEFYKLPKDSFYSIFLEILSEEPPLPLFSVPMVYREGKLVFDGLDLLKNEKFLSENLKTGFQFDERTGRLNIVTPSGKVEKVFYYEDGKFIKR